MPHAIIKLYPGKSEEIKSRLADAVAQNIAAIAECREGAVSVAIEEITPADWAEKVYKPEILEKPETLYKKPDYNPFK
jgi:4-oxalocrotonate tautomerase